MTDEFKLKTSCKICGGPIGNDAQAIRLGFCSGFCARGLSTPEPPPKPTDGRPIWELVICDMQQRDQEGRRKYGVPLQAGNGRDALIDAYQEALDLCVYLRQAIEERATSAVDDAASKPDS